MSKAKLCVCGHNAADHKQLVRTKPVQWGACYWDGCECAKYLFKELLSPNLGTGRRWEELDTLIDASINHLDYNKRKRVNQLYIADCNIQGKHNGFKQTFDNGEYP